MGRNRAMTWSGARRHGAKWGYSPGRHGQLGVAIGGFTAGLLLLTAAPLSALEAREYSEEISLDSIVNAAKPAISTPDEQVLPTRQWKGGYEFSSDRGDAAHLPSNPNGRITLAPQHGTAISVELPFAEHMEEGTQAADGSVLYSSSGDTDFVVQVFGDASVAIHSVIGSPRAPHSIPYDFSLPSAAELKLLSDGAVLVSDSRGDFLALVAKPWATDAAGRKLETRYEIAGHTLVQIVEPGHNPSYPIVADPYLGIALIDNVIRNYHTGQGYRYYVAPSVFARAIQPASVAGLTARTPAWNEAKGYYSQMNTASIRDQFYCHWDYKASGLTIVKSTWNLEAWRPHTTYRKLLNAKCNN